MNLAIKKGCNSSLKSKEYHLNASNHSILSIMAKRCKQYFVLIFCAKKTSLLNANQ